MSARRFATIDVGTNTTLLLVAEGTTPADVRVLEDRAEITRLGRGIGTDGRLGADGIARTLAALHQYEAVARQHGAEVIAVGTEALRRAPNANAFVQAAAEILRAPLQVIDGDREAALSFLAAQSSFPDAARGTVTVVDIGGGSTEVIVAAAGTISSRHSLPLGSVRLTERHVRTDPAAPGELDALTAEVRATLAPVKFPDPREALLIGTAGTVTTLAAMAQGLASYDPNLVHGYRLTVAALETQVARLRRSTQREREGMAGLDPKRSDVILAGACLLLDLARHAGVDAIVVSDRGIRWGLLYERLAVPPAS